MELLYDSSYLLERFLLRSETNKQTNKQRHKWNSWNNLMMTHIFGQNNTPRNSFYHKNSSDHLLQKQVYAWVSLCVSQATESNSPILIQCSLPNRLCSRSCQHYLASVVPVSLNTGSNSPIFIQCSSPNRLNKSAPVTSKSCLQIEYKAEH